MSEHQDPYNRNKRGHFGKDNPGGPGNPYARGVARLKARMLEVIDADKLAAYILRLYEMAMEGDHQAGKMLLSYVLGKPEKARDPDQIDVEEWDILKKEALIVEEMPYLLNKPGPEFPLTAVRTARPYMTKHYAQQLHDKFDEEREYERQEEEKKETRRQKRQAKKKAQQATEPPSPNGGKRCEAPLPNGNFGEEVPLPNGELLELAPIANGPHDEETPLPNGGKRYHSPSPNGRAAGLLERLWRFGRDNTEPNGGAPDDPATK